MQPRLEKARPGAREARHTSNPEVQNITPRMHFYAVLNAGDRLRWEGAPRTSKTPERMVGR